jgi:hypothetical protein
LFGFPRERPADVSLFVVVLSALASPLFPGDLGRAADVALFVVVVILSAFASPLFPGDLLLTVLLFLALSFLLLLLRSPLKAVGVYHCLPPRFCRLD